MQFFSPKLRDQSMVLTENHSLFQSKYMNDSGLTVPEKFSVQRTYIIFRTLGLRHLTVIDTSNQVTGIITRKDLMGHNIVEKLSKIISQPSRLEMMEINDNGAV